MKVKQCAGVKRTGERCGRTLDAGSGSDLCWQHDPIAIRNYARRREQDRAWNEAKRRLRERSGYRLLYA